ncbi:MAG: hypothetical protein ACK5RO_05990 [Pseudobdellovibrionaceae bacterium]
MAVVIFFLISGFVVLVSSIYLGVVFHHYFVEWRKKKEKSNETF